MGVRAEESGAWRKIPGPRAGFISAGATERNMTSGLGLGMLTAAEASVHQAGCEEGRRALSPARGPASRELPPVHTLLTVNENSFTSNPLYSQLPSPSKAHISPSSRKPSLMSRLGQGTSGLPSPWAFLCHNLTNRFSPFPMPARASCHK